MTILQGCVQRAGESSYVRFRVTPRPAADTLSTSTDQAAAAAPPASDSRPFPAPATGRNSFPRNTLQPLDKQSHMQYNGPMIAPPLAPVLASSAPPVRGLIRPLRACVPSCRRALLPGAPVTPLLPVVTPLFLPLICR